MGIWIRWHDTPSKFYEYIYIRRHNDCQIRTFINSKVYIDLYMYAQLFSWNLLKYLKLIQSGITLVSPNKIGRISDVWVWGNDHSDTNQEFFEIKLRIISHLRCYFCFINLFFDKEVARVNQHPLNYWNPIFLIESCHGYRVFNR